ncbi:MAG: AFG1 family ATPase [Hyphomicrobiaceae bacterium]|nr:AFG1 family ATPase [Hyphomicrobiaceae bacterium]
MEGPLSFEPSLAGTYEALVAKGDIRADNEQKRIVGLLDGLLQDLAAMRMQRKSSALGWLFAKKAKPEPVRGLYLWGGVGRGKTLLMDLFFEKVPLRRKRRAHFHAFMSDVHERVHAWRQALKMGAVKGDDPIPPVAASLAEEARVLCFDEFHVTDIADAMILGRLFTELFNAGVVLVATSNAPPDGLYKDGLNRQLFLPFVGLLKNRVNVHELISETDYRLEKLEAAPVWYAPEGEAADAAMDAAWDRLTHKADGVEMALHVKGRLVTVPRQAHGVARFTFDDLCARPLGVEDYLTLAMEFHTLMIDRIPLLDDQNRNETRRFINLVDTLYDTRTKLVASAAAVQTGLYSGAKGYEAFAFDRTASRLIDMASEDYLAAPRQAGNLPIT